MKKDKARLFIETIPELQPAKLQKKTLERRSQRIWNFIERRDCISLSCLASKVGYNRSNLNKYMAAKKKLPEHLLLKLEKELEKYGLNV